MNVRLTKEQKVNIHSSGDIYKIMQQILLRENKISRSQEHFWVVGLDIKNKILFIELISLGATNAALVKPREVFRMAIYKLAVKMILVHNHPSGNIEPSDRDNDFTDRLMKSGEMLGVKVVDHLIISEEAYTSYKDAGILDGLAKNGRYQLIEKEQEELRKLKIEVEKEKAIKKDRIIIAKKLKELGHDNDTIKQITGLTKWDIRKL